MGMKSPPTPPSLGLPPPAAHPSTLGSIAQALRAQRGKANTGVFTADNTIATSPRGVTGPANTARTTLLGQ